MINVSLFENIINRSAAIYIVIVYKLRLRSAYSIEYKKALLSQRRPRDAPNI